jgi:hypothetical protein
MPPAAPDTPAGAASAPGDDPVLALLARERAHLLAEVERVPAARRGERPAPDRWSVHEVVEHVARVDRGVALILAARAAQPLAATPEELAGAHMTPARGAAVRDRSRRFDAPERVRPTGTVPPEAALAQLAAARAALVAAYGAADAAVLDGAVHPHPVLGPVTLRGWFELAAHHDARHAQQVAELAAALGAAPTGA